jgi:hypothetical protein
VRSFHLDPTGNFKRQTRESVLCQFSADKSNPKPIFFKFYQTRANCHSSAISMSSDSGQGQSTIESRYFPTITSDAFMARRHLNEQS